MSDIDPAAEGDPRDEERLTTADLADQIGGSDGGEGEPERREPEGRAFSSPADKDTADGQAGPLYPSAEAQSLRERWDSIQAGFVDEPRRAVEQADSLVAEAMKRLAETFADERAVLERQWDRGGDVSTEDLRQALRRYRSFFTHLLSV